MKTKTTLGFSPKVAVDTELTKARVVYLLMPRKKDSDEQGHSWL
jgi:hypothetical protein